MAFKLGSTSINKSYLGSTLINKLYLGSTLVYNSSSLTPILTSFNIDDTNKDRVNFSTPLGYPDGLSITGFTVSGKTISSITKVNDTSGYFTVAVAFDYWDNNTIRKESGDNTLVYDFTMEYITNNIPEPTILEVNYRYVATTGNDTNDGLSELTAKKTLKNAIQSLPSGGGYKIWVKAGTYNGENILDADTFNGNVSAPYIVEGYIATIGDITTNYYSLTPNTTYTALDPAQMPVFDGGNSASGRFIYNDDDPYWIWKNIQVTGYAEAFRSRFSNVQGQQVINCNIKDIGVIASNYGYGIYWVNSTNTANRNRVVNTNLINIESNAIVFDGDHNLAIGCKVYSQNGTTASEGTDYYYQIEASNNIIKDCLAYNDGNGGHNGHGFSCKTAGVGVDEEVHYNLIDGCEAVAIQGAFQARHANCKYNVWKNSIARADIPNRKEGSSDNYTGAIDFQSGGDQNVFENLVVHDTHQFIRFNLNAESDSDANIQTNALIKNCLVYNVKNVITANSVVAGTSAPSGNKLANCTIYNADNMFWQYTGTGSVVFGLNKIENCIIDDVTVLNKDEVVAGWTYDYNNIWTSWATTIGTNSLNLNPNYVDLVDFKPQNQLIKVGKAIDNVFYDLNNVERANVTGQVMIGAVE